ncbi:MAG: hypothetical protein RBU25_01435 [Lentisphaeria bacterium]|jgi:hypothetical protein|nr:hypothetical protein [Lentisphaeria bacterium]
MPRESSPLGSWNARRLLRLALPPLVVLAVAWWLREGPESEPDRPAAPAAERIRQPMPADGTLAPAPAARLLVFADDGTLAATLRDAFGAEVGVTPVPAESRAVLAREYGLAEFPAVVIERDGARLAVLTGAGARADAVLERCRELGWQTQAD